MQTRTNPIQSPKSQNFTACPSGLLLTQNPSQLSCSVIVNSRTCFCFGDCHNKHQKGVCHTCGLAIDIKKYLKAKEEELWKLKYFTMPKYNLQNILYKKTQILQDIITL
jgi:hypothetical protein